MVGLSFCLHIDFHILANQERVAWETLTRGFLCGLSEDLKDELSRRDQLLGKGIVRKHAARLPLFLPLSPRLLISLPHLHLLFNLRSHLPIKSLPKYSSHLNTNEPMQPGRMRYPCRMVTPNIYYGPADHILAYCPAIGGPWWAIHMLFHAPLNTFSLKVLCPGQRFSNLSKSSKILVQMIICRWLSLI